MAVYVGTSGQMYDVGKMVSEDASGTEGDICHVIGMASIVAKIYHESVLASEGDKLERKLTLLIDKNLHDQYGDFSFAWPKELLYKKENNKRKFVGYIMRKVEAEYNLAALTLHDPDSPTPGSNGIQGYITWKEMIHAAYNLSALVEYLHMNGIEIGDFNERNFLFNAGTGGFDLIDCGTYGIFDPSTHESIFSCGYGMPEYTAPEVLLNLKTKDPRYTDYFYLAIHIFHLLMKNTNPFGYKEDLNGNPIDRLHRHIINGDCLYVKTIPGRVLKKHAVKPGVLPDDILAAFDRTFNYTSETVSEHIKDRTTATEWRNILRPYFKDPSRIKQCPEKKQHVFSAK